MFTSITDVCFCCLPLIFSVVELATPSDSADSSHSLPAKLMLDLVQLTLVCLQHCTSMASPSGALESNKRDLTSSIASVLNKHLFDAVVELLVAVPEVITEMLPLLLKIVSGMEFLANFAARVMLHTAESGKSLDKMEL